MKENTEGNVFAARWKKTTTGYVAWLTRVPGTKVTGKMQDELCEQLWEVAMDRFGDGEACIDLMPPFPAETDAPAYFHPEWFHLSANEAFRTVGDRSVLYAKGLCSFCGTGLGGRTNKVRKLDWIPKSDFAFVWMSRPSAPIVSEAFVDFFRPLLGRQMRTVPCEPGRASRKRFFELELTGSVPLKTHREATERKGIVCPKCRLASFGMFVCPVVGKGLLYGVSWQDIKSVRRPASVVYGGTNLYIIVNKKIATALKKFSGLKGVLLDRVAILPSKEIGSFALKKLTRADVSNPLSKPR